MGELIPFVVLTALLAMPIMAQGGRATCDMWNRCAWFVFWCGVALAYGMWAVNPFASAAFAMIVGGALSVAPWEQAFPRALYPAYAAGIAWLVLAPAMTPVLVLPICVGLALMGCWFGAWAVFSNWQGQRPYQIRWGHLFGWIPRPLFCWHEDSPTHLKAGQGNANHLLCLAVLSLAAVVGVALLWSPWVLVLAPLPAFPLLLRVNKEGILSQAHVHLLTLGIACAMILIDHGSLALALLVGFWLCAFVLVKPWQAHPRGWDGRRLQLWHVTIREVWWPLGWRRRLLGVGTATWEPLTSATTMQRINGTVFTTAHNEYVQFLVEHGIVGLVCLGLYLVMTATRLWAGGLEGRVLFIMLLTLCSIAAANFPWSWFHEIPQPPTCHRCHKKAFAPGLVVPDRFCQCPEPRQLGPSQPFYVGSPGLLAVSLVLAILAEGIR